MRPISSLFRRASREPAPAQPQRPVEKRRSATLPQGDSSLGDLERKGSRHSSARSDSTATMRSETSRPKTLSRLEKFSAMSQRGASRGNDVGSAAHPTMAGRAGKSRIDALIRDILSDTRGLRTRLEERVPAEQRVDLAATVLRDIATIYSDAISSAAQSRPLEACLDRIRVAQALLDSAPQTDASAEDMQVELNRVLDGVLGGGLPIGLDAKVGNRALAIMNETGSRNPKLLLAATFADIRRMSPQQARKLRADLIGNASLDAALCDAGILRRPVVGKVAGMRLLHGTNEMLARLRAHETGGGVVSKVDERAMELSPAEAEELRANLSRMDTPDMTFDEKFSGSLLAHPFATQESVARSVMDQLERMIAREMDDSRRRSTTRKKQQAQQAGNMEMARVLLHATSGSKELSSYDRARADMLVNKVVNRLLEPDPDRDLSAKDNIAAQASAAKLRGQLAAQRMSMPVPALDKHIAALHPLRLGGSAIGRDGVEEFLRPQVGSAQRT